MQAVEDNSFRDGLIEEYREFVVNVAHKMVRAMNLPVRYADEFVSAGYLGLVEAAERFDPAAGRDFKTFAFLRIRGAIIDSIRQSSELSGGAYRYSRAMQAAVSLREELYDLDTQDPPNQIRVEDKRRKLADILDFAAKGALAFKLSMSDVASEVNKVEDSSQDPEEQLQKRQKIKKLLELVETLPEKERTIIREYYFNEKSFVEIAGLYEGMSKSWVSRLHSRALEKLARAACAEEFRS